MNDEYPELPIEDYRTPLDHAEETIAHMSGVIDELSNALDCAVDGLQDALSGLIYDHDLFNNVKTILETVEPINNSYKDGTS